MTVRLNRLFDFPGAFQVRLVLPPAVQGLEADEVTIPPGQNEARPRVRVAAHAAPGNRTGLIARATAVLNDTIATTREARFGVNVSR